MKKACEYLLIGQGLAGSSLAMHLLDRGASVLMLDDQRPESSSRVAAGLFNPVTGRNMVKTWMADSLFPYLKTFYCRMEGLTGASFLHQKPIYRPFVSIEEQNEWMGKSADSDFQPYLDSVRKENFMEGVHDPYGGILLKESGYLDIPVYLEAMAQMFREQGILYKETLENASVELSEDSVTMAGITAKKIIFCDGTSAVSNTFFDWLPFRPVKGEIIEVAMDARFPAIVNRGVFVVTLEEGVFRVGSTYNNRELDWEPSEEGQSYLINRLSQLVEATPRIIRHYAGIRPATADRRPIIGLHPEYETIGLFNGLGTKGVSLAPWFGKHLAAYLTDGNALLEDVNISRYFSLY